MAKKKEDPSLHVMVILPNRLPQKVLRSTAIKFKNKHLYQKADILDYPGDAEYIEVCNEYRKNKADAHKTARTSVLDAAITPNKLKAENDELRAMIEAQQKQIEELLGVTGKLMGSNKE